LVKKAYDRCEEAEADHIGVFLMAFAGYDPKESVQFWQKMQTANGRAHLPEILSDHPSDAGRIRLLQGWIRYAVAAKKAYDRGNVAPAKKR
jgi:predicted Zn-dependent protease